MAEARARASRRRKEAVSAFQWPPTSSPKTTRRPPAAVELGIGLPALAPGSCAHSKTRLGLCAGVWSAIPRHRANQSRIDCELGTMPEREAVV